ncbi:MAG: leucyl aminopeptidase [Candidatus Margulisbacteria bacterium]|nr:leucyl aminopeptidase [Candidatus Margulisiibacteriota bacterium]
MKIKTLCQSITRVPYDLLVVNEFEGVKAPGGATGAIDKALKGAISDLIKSGEITGKLGEVNVIHTQGKLPAKQVLIVGLGKSADFTIDHCRIAAGAAIAEAKRVKAQKVATIVHGAGAGGLTLPAAAQALIEGTLIGAYHYTGFATIKDESFFAVEELIVVEQAKSKIKDINQGVKIGRIIAESVNNARDLVNAPANRVSPSFIAQKAKEVAGVSVKIINLSQAKRLGMEAFYSVSKGSKEPAKFIVMKYGKGKPEIALVGKGITFDAGGISLKPSNALWKMRDDMAGAAAVLETMRAIARLKVRKNVVGILPCTENMPDGNAQKPGDVVGSLSGKTIEIISTDAEGRMVLADAVTYAKKLGVKKIIDVATLTGACVSALGDAASGIMGSDQNLVDSLISAGKKSGEKLWQLPLFEEYKEYSKSKIADIKNCTEQGKASPSIGGLFIQLFAEDTPWAHIDIAGTAFLDKRRWYLSSGATGAMVRTLTAYLMG